MKIDNCKFDLSRIRNIGIAAHIDAGKTTTTEGFLYYAGKIHRIGKVDDGTAQMDWMDQEKERGITITAAATTLYWKDYTFNLIDTPGHVDFTVEVERSLRVLDGAVIVLCSVGGVEPQTETIWRQVNNYKVPRVVFVNKMDRTGADFKHAVTMLQEKLKAKCAPINIPWGEEDKFCGVIDLLNMRVLRWSDEDQGSEVEVLPIPDELSNEAIDARENLLEMLAEYDDELLKLFLDNSEIPIESIKRAIRKGTIEHGFVPVLAGSALKHKGIQPLLDAVVDFLPSPEELPPVIGIHPKTGMQISRIPDPKKPMSALAFKVATDKYVDRLTYLRIYSGTIKVGGQYLNPRTRRKERIQKIFRMHSNKRDEIRSTYGGDVVAVAGLRTVSTGDTLCDPNKPIVFEEMMFPVPVIFVAVEPKTKAEEEKMFRSLKQFSIEDPTFHYKEDPETGQIIISGMGELHLDIILDRMRREYDVEVNAGKPQVAYRETITKTSKAHAILDRYVGEKKLYAEVILKVEPGQVGTGVIINDRLPSDCNLPQPYRDAIVAECKSSMENGAIAGYPLLDLIVNILDVTFDEYHLSEVAFSMATSQAFIQAVRTADPVILEPVMKIDVIVPENNLGDVIGDLVSRTAEIQGIDHRSDGEVILAIVPLDHMFGYTTILRSLTRGLGFFVMQFSHYRRLPKAKEEKLLFRIKGF